MSKRQNKKKCTEDIRAHLVSGRNKSLRSRPNSRDSMEISSKDFEKMSENLMTKMNENFDTKYMYKEMNEKISTKFLSLLMNMPKSGMSNHGAFI